MVCISVNSRDNRWTVGGRPAVAFPSESSRYQLIVVTVELSEVERAVKVMLFNT